MRFVPIPKNLEKINFDLIIIGGGINGTAIARDASLRGLKVLLLEKEDIAGGTSARSARMIHGGLRYLERFDFHLVWESLKERKNLLKIAPHLVKKQPLIIPFYKHGQHNSYIIRLGLTVLDMFSVISSSWLGAHQNLTSSKVLKLIPSINPSGLTGGAVMQDAYAQHAERFCIENVIAAQENDALIINYAKVTNFITNPHSENVTEVIGVQFQNEITKQNYQVHAPLTINVSGPWVDQVLKGEKWNTNRLIGGTKGSFLVVNPFEGAPQASLFYEAISDGRQVVILPWNNRYLIGSTDLRYDQDPGKASAEKHEINYLLKETNRIFPNANLDYQSILFTYTGVRPLPYQNKSGATGNVTRKHIIYDHAPEVKGVISIIGGKLSTFRSLAKETVDVVFKKRGTPIPQCHTATRPLPGGGVNNFLEFCEQFRKSARLPSLSIERLLKIYGIRCLDVMEISDRGNELKRPFDQSTGAIGAEVVFAVEKEMAVNLCDILMRRTMVGFDSDLNLDSAKNAAKIARKYLGWDEQRVSSEIQLYQEFISQFTPKI